MPFHSEIELYVDLTNDQGQTVIWDVNVLAEVAMYGPSWIASVEGFKLHNLDDKTPEWVDPPEWIVEPILRALASPKHSKFIQREMEIRWQDWKEAS